MLFSKKKRFEITEKQTKEDITSPDGIIVLKMNLKYPKIECSKTDKMNLYAKPLYEKLVSGFMEYVKGELKKKAIDAYNADSQGFIPFSAIMSWENTLCDDSYLSLLLDISICDSHGHKFTQRKTQVWDRKSGMKCDCLEFISPAILKETKKQCTENKDMGFFHKDLFVICENGIRFFTLKNGEYIPLPIIGTDKMAKETPTA